MPLGAARALDVGCGTGFPLFELAERLGPRARVVGLDPWGVAFRRARAKGTTWPVPNAFPVRGDGAALPFRDGSFDLVVSNLGVNNFADPGAAFRECRRVLGLGGVLALATNLVGHMAELYEAFERVLAGDDAALARLREHVAHRATVDGLERALAAAGMRVADVRERLTVWRYATADALLGHHFIRLGFLPAWEEVAGSPHAMDRLRDELDRLAHGGGELRLTVPLAYVEARVP